MEIKDLNEKLAYELDLLGFKLYECYYEKKNNILHVSIDASLDMNEIEEISKKVSEIMDKYDEDMDAYMLDVSSCGIEKKIRNADEIKEAIGSYIHVKGKGFKYYGDLEDFDGAVITLKTMEKNISKTIKINYSDVKAVRYAVKF